MFSYQFSKTKLVNKLQFDRLRPQTLVMSQIFEIKVFHIWKSPCKK